MSLREVYPNSETIPINSTHFLDIRFSGFRVVDMVSILKNNGRVSFYDEEPMQDQKSVIRSLAVRIRTNRDDGLPIGNLEAHLTHERQRLETLLNQQFPDRKRTPPESLSGAFGIEREKD